MFSQNCKICWIGCTIIQVFPLDLYLAGRKPNDHFGQSNFKMEGDQLDQLRDPKGVALEGEEPETFWSRVVERRTTTHLQTTTLHHQVLSLVQFHHSEHVRLWQPP